MPLRPTSEAHPLAKKKVILKRQKGKNYISWMKSKKHIYLYLFRTMPLRPTSEAHPLAKKNVILKRQKERKKFLFLLYAQETYAKEMYAMLFFIIHYKHNHLWFLSFFVIFFIQTKNCSKFPQIENRIPVLFWWSPATCNKKYEHIIFTGMGWLRLVGSLEL